VKAAVLHGPRKVRIEATPEPALGPEDALVHVALAGLCGTDYRIWNGDRAVDYPRVLGHEVVGRVAAIGRAVTDLHPGDRVVIEPNYSCGVCPLCHEGNRNLCLKRTAVGIDVDGGFAELVRLPSRCCWPLPTAVGDDDAILTEPLAVVVRAVNRAAVTGGETAAVVGAGTLGLLALQVLRARGARLLVVSRTSTRFPLARELGAERAHALTEGDVDAVAREFSGREGVDVVIETAGTAEAVTHALTLVRPGGRVVLTGLPHEPTSVPFASLVRREVTVTGSMIYGNEFPEALQLLAEGAIRTRPLLTHRLALDAIDRAFSLYREPTSIKVTLVP